jgi:hypothetical protein
MRGIWIPASACSYLLRWGRYKINDGYMASADEVRCKHGEVADWCGESECMAARKGLPVHVWRTSQGQVYHRGPACEALLDGQRLAGQVGSGTSEPEQVRLSDAMAEGLAECYHCFPPGVPLDAKPCRVLVGGRWVDGFLLKWWRDASNRWQGLVNYRWEGSGRKVAIKDQSELRPDPGRRRTPPAAKP